MHVSRCGRISTRNIFEGKGWTDRARDVYESVKDQRAGGKWIGLSDSPAQRDVHDCLFQLQDSFLSKERRRYYTINLPRELTMGEAQRQIDRKSGNPSDTEHYRKDIEVIGELKASNKNSRRRWFSSPDTREMCLPSSRRTAISTRLPSADHL